MLVFGASAEVMLMHLERVVASGCVGRVFHGEGRISPDTPRNSNNDQPSTGQPQEAVQTLTKPNQARRYTLVKDWVDCRRFLSFVFPGGARRLKLSPCC